MKKKMLALSMAVLMAASLAGCSSGTKDAETTAAASETGAETAAESEGETAAADKAEEGKTAEGGTLIMGTNATFPPYEYYEGDEIVGIDVEIAQAIGEKLGMEVTVEDMEFDALIPALASNKVDIVAAGMTVTPERQKSVNFTDTYATAAQVIIVKQGSDIASSEDLNGKILGVQMGTTGDSLASEIEGAQVERFNKYFEAIQSVLQGKIDAVIIDSAPAKAFAEKDENLVILEEALSSEDYAMAVNKDNTELLDKVNAAIAELDEEGTLDEIVDKYIPAE
ncbi:MAG: basic amino acid ABC transporter substrate-binding protein [Clostridium sp.]|jgi:ABC-type amino acid transport substrate-binding protein|nr:basic amino acid ABC transporter substrate-binding protein [Clostridium sp.]